MMLQENGPLKQAGKNFLNEWNWNLSIIVTIFKNFKFQRSR